MLKCANKNTKSQFSSMIDGWDATIYGFALVLHVYSQSSALDSEFSFVKSIREVIGLNKLKK